MLIFLSPEFNILNYVSHLIALQMVLIITIVLPGGGGRGGIGEDVKTSAHCGLSVRT